MSGAAQPASTYRQLIAVLQTHFAAQPPRLPGTRGVELPALTTARFRDAAYDLISGCTYLSGVFTAQHAVTDGRSVAGVTRLRPDSSWDETFAVAFEESPLGSAAPAALLPSGTALYAGGGFTLAADADGACSTSGLVRIDALTGRLDRTWLPSLPGTAPLVTALAVLHDAQLTRLAVALSCAPYLLLCDPADAAATRVVPLEDGPVTLLRVVGNGLYVSTHQDAVLNRLRRFTLNPADGSLFADGWLANPPHLMTNTQHEP